MKNYGMEKALSGSHGMRFLFQMITLILIGFALFTDVVSGSEKSEAHKAADSLSMLMQQGNQALPLFDSTNTIEDYLTVAMKNNPGLKAAFNQWVANLKKSDYAGALPDPMFGYGYFIEKVETRVGPQEQRFSLRQSFPWFGTLGAKKDMAFAASQASYKRFESARLKLFYEVKSAFYDYYYLGRDIQITNDNLELLKFWESVARSKYKVGLKQYPDVIKAQVELGKLEDHLHTLQDKQVPASARLRALLGLPGGELLPIPSKISVDESGLVEDSVVALIIRNNPDLMALQQVIESSRAGERLAGKQALPQFSVGVDYIQTGPALNPDLPESGKDPWMVSASVSLPIWFGKNGARKSEAKARRKAAEYNLDDNQNRLTAAARKVLFEYSDALRKTKLYRDGLVPKAEQSLKAIYASYESGGMGFLNVLDAQRQLLDFQLTVAREKAALATKRAEIEMLGGTELDKYTQK